MKHDCDLRALVTA